MKHLEDIHTFVDVLLGSKTFHALVIESPPGWGKSSSIGKILHEKKLHFECISTYSTAYHLYTALRQNPRALFVVDDCSGITSDSIALSVLKSATWPASGTDSKRLLMWGSGEKDETPPVEFTGKIILLVNSVGHGMESKSFLSRALYLPILGNAEDRSQILLTAAQNREIYPNFEVASKVSEYLSTKLAHLAKVNLRTLRLGYELAEQFPDRWESLVERLFIGQKSPEATLDLLSETDLSVEEQAKKFQQETGLSRRSFFNYKKRLKR